MTDDQYKKLVETIEGNTKVINLLHIAIVGLIEALHNSEDEENSEEPPTYLDGSARKCDLGAG